MLATLLFVVFLIVPLVHSGVMQLVISTMFLSTHALLLRKNVLDLG